MKNIKSNLLILRFLLPNIYKKIFLTSALLISIIGTFAQTAGSLDLSFGGTGIVTTDMAGSSDEGKSVAIQADGKIVVAGSSNNGSDYDFALVRYNADGTLDTTFGSSGKVITPIGSSDDEAHSVTIQIDGKIVVAGSSNNGSDYDFALVRYNTDGTLDNTFGINGKVITPVGSYHDRAFALVIQTNGKIVAVGYSYDGAPADFTAIRYNSDGTLDSTFGTGGIVTTPVCSLYDAAQAVAIQTDGKIVAAGGSDNGSDYDFALVRYNTDGTLDNTFGTDGIVITDIGSIDYAIAMVIQVDEKIVLAGYSYIDIAVVRYNTDGTLDNTFGTGGQVITPVGGYSDAAQAVAMQTDGKIVAAGGSSNGSDFDISLVRYNTNGTLDTTFGTGGIVITPVGDSWDEASAVAIQTNGKIVVAGKSDNGSNNDFAVLRYMGVVNNIPEIKGSDNFVVFPNPTDNNFTIEAYISADNKGIIKIYGLKGKLIKEFVLKKGGNKTIVNTLGWRKGIYICNLIINGKVIKSEKMVLVR